MEEENIRKKKLLPESVEGIDVNFCKNPACGNYGQLPSRNRPRGRYAASKSEDEYTIVGTSRGLPVLYCKKCKESGVIKSNLGIYEEFRRLSDYLDNGKEYPSCPNKECPHNNIDIDAGERCYRLSGKTRSGSQRYLCKKCGTTFSVKQKSITGQKKSYLNIGILEQLTNGTKLRRIARMKHINVKTLYQKIEFLHNRALAFLANRERKIVDTLSDVAEKRAIERTEKALAAGEEPPSYNEPISKLYIGVDRQEHYVNWSRTKDKRNVVLQIVASAENNTGYVLAANLNYDPTLDAEKIEEDALVSGDYEIKKPYRRYARLWLERDYYESVKNGKSEKASLDACIEQGDSESGILVEDDVTEQHNINTQLPAKGMQIHSEYTLYGHFLLLRRLLRGIDKIRFFMDREPGIRSACLFAFYDEILEKKCDAFFVKINKTLNNHEKNISVQKSKKILRDFKETREEYAFMKDWDVAAELIKTYIDFPKDTKWYKRWVTHTCPNMGEPEKELCWLTDLQDNSYDKTHLAYLYLKGSQRAVDNFFYRLREGVSLFARPTTSASNTGRKWYSNNAYNPAILMKVLDIYRVVYNYVEIGEDGKTPAMRLGLARAPLKYEDIIYYI